MRSRHLDEVEARIPSGRRRLLVSQPSSSSQQSCNVVGVVRGVSTSEVAMMNCPSCLLAARMSPSRKSDLRKRTSARDVRQALISIRSLLVHRARRLTRQHSSTACVRECWLRTAGELYQLRRGVVPSVLRLALVVLSPDDAVDLGLSRDRAQARDEGHQGEPGGQNKHDG